MAQNSQGPRAGAAGGVGVQGSRGASRWLALRRCAQPTPRLLQTILVQQHADTPWLLAEDVEACSRAYGHTMGIRPTGGGCVARVCMSGSCVPRARELLLAQQSTTAVGRHTARHTTA